MDPQNQLFNKGIFSRDSDLTTSFRDEDMFKDIHIFIQYIHIHRNVDVL